MHVPEHTKPLPAWILLHGWMESGFKGTSWSNNAVAISNARGHVVLTLSMRGWPDTGGIDDCGGKQPRDISKVFEWICKRPEVDENRVFLFGKSQGGQVALLAGALTNRVAGIVAVSPVTDIKSWREQSDIEAIRNIYVPDVCGEGEIAERKSPINYAKDIQAPVLLIHGDSDTRVPTDQSIRMHDKLIKYNRDIELFLVKGGTHNLTEKDPKEWDKAWVKLESFTQRILN